MAERIHKSLFPLLRRLSDGRFHSGEALAREFGLSRASISNVLGQAAAVGLAVHAVRGRGYRLPEVVEWLDCGRVVALLGPVAKAYRLACVDTLASTNTTLMTGAPGMDRDGSVLCAEHQQVGKGRRGRDWHSVVGGSLTFSVLWRFDNGLQSLGGLSLAAGLAVARAVNRHSIHPARLKWPNDVLVGYRKLAVIETSNRYYLIDAVKNIGQISRISCRTAGIPLFQLTQIGFGYAFTLCIGMNPSFFIANNPHKY